MPRFSLRVRTYSFVLALIGAGFTFRLRLDVISDGVRTSVEQHHGNGVADHQVGAAVGTLHAGSANERMIDTLKMQFELTGKIVASIVEPVANWPDAPCIRSDEQPPPIRDLWNIGIPQQPERPLGYSALDHCTPIFIDRGGKHSDGDSWGGTGVVVEGFYEKTSTGGRIEVNPNALIHKTEKYRAVVLAHEELHAVLDWLDPIGLNEAILPTYVVDKARTQLREAGYEGADIDDEILPRLLTHDHAGTGLTGVAEEDQVISGAMRRLLAESQTDPELKRVYQQLQRSHALTHDLMSGKARIGTLMCGREQRPSNPQKFARPTSRFSRSMP
jgi:hypothetical protein